MNVSHLSHYCSAGFSHVMAARAPCATSVSSFAVCLATSVSSFALYLVQLVNPLLHCALQLVYTSYFATIEV